MRCIMNTKEDKKLTGDKEGLKKSGIIQLIRVSVALVLQVVIFFAAAGHFNLPRAWIFFGVTFLYFVISTIIVARFNPELINERTTNKSGSKSRDKLFLSLYVLLGLYIQPAVIGLDVGRFQWSSLGIVYLAVGYVIYLISCILNILTMVENPYFEATVRIQEDRDQHVVTTGPYKMVRHPGYLAAILWAAAAPLAIGSVFGLAAGGLVLVVLILRTSFEDKTLQSELPGYDEYTRRVKYRLFPGVW